MEPARTSGAKLKLSNLCPNHPKVLKICREMHFIKGYLPKGSSKVGMNARPNFPLQTMFLEASPKLISVLLYKREIVKLNWKELKDKIRKYSQSFRFGILTEVAAIWQRAAIQTSTFTQWLSIRIPSGHRCPFD